MPMPGEQPSYAAPAAVAPAAPRTVNHQPPPIAVPPPVANSDQLATANLNMGNAAANMGLAPGLPTNHPTAQAANRKSAASAQAARVAQGNAARQQRNLPLGTVVSVAEDANLAVSAVMVEPGLKLVIVQCRATGQLTATAVPVPV